MSMGSNPVFPTILYNYSFAYLINLININKAGRNLYFEIIFTKKVFKFLFFLKKFNFIYKYVLVNKNQSFYIKIYLYYYKNKKICSHFKLISRPSHLFSISYKALRLIDKRSGSSIFILSTSIGLISHKEALKNNITGNVIGFFSI